MDRRIFLKTGAAAATGGALLLMNPAGALMATIPQTERNAAIDNLMRMVGEDVNAGGRFLNFLNFAFPGFNWIGILRTRAANWQPFIDAGLSITYWCDEVERFAAFYAQQ